MKTDWTAKVSCPHGGNGGCRAAMGTDPPVWHWCKANCEAYAPAPEWKRYRLRGERWECEVADIADGCLPLVCVKGGIHTGTRVRLDSRVLDALFEIVYMGRINLRTPTITACRTTSGIMPGTVIVPAGQSDTNTYDVRKPPTEAEGGELFYRIPADTFLALFEEDTVDPHGEECREAFRWGLHGEPSLPDGCDVVVHRLVCNAKEADELALLLRDGFQRNQYHPGWAVRLYLLGEVDDEDARECPHGGEGNCWAAARHKLPSEEFCKKQCSAYKGTSDVNDCDAPPDGVDWDFVQKISTWDWSEEWPMARAAQSAVFLARALLELRDRLDNRDKWCAKAMDIWSHMPTQEDVDAAVEGYNKLEDRLDGLYQSLRNHNHGNRFDEIDGLRSRCNEVHDRMDVLEDKLARAVGDKTCITIDLEPGQAAELVSLIERHIEE